MNNANKFIIIVIIAILIFLFQYKTDEKQWVNKASYSQIVAAEKEVKTIKKAKPTVVEEEIPPIELDDNTLELEKSNHLTYLDIYKKYKLAIDCNGIYMDKDSKHDKGFYIDEFIGEIKYRSNIRQNEVTEAQLRSYEDFVNECWDLYLQMPDISNLTLLKIKQDPYITRITLKKLLQSTDAFTPEEVELKTVLITGFDFSTVDDNLSKLSRGTHTLDDEELRATYKEIDGMKSKISRLEFDNPYSYDVDEHNRLTLELREIEDYLADSIVIDESELQSEKLQFDKFAREIVIHAKTPYATVFSEVFNTLNFTREINGVLEPNYSFYSVKKYKEDYQSFAQKIYSDSILTHEKYFDHAINPAIYLYLCHLGADCSADSIVMRKYCASNRGIYGELRQYVYSEACDKSLLEFYSQSFLSASLANDVDLLLKYLVNKYAH